MKQASLFSAVLLLILYTVATATGVITGQGRFAKIAGRPAAGYKYLYEADLFLCGPDDAMIGPARRLGAPPGQQPTGDGYYRIENLPAGSYSIYVNQPDFFITSQVIPNVEVIDGQQTTVDIDLDVDYSTYFNSVWTDWHWTWYQTFKATGTSVRGVSWKMAGWGLYSGKKAEISILEDNGDGDVRNWTVLATLTDYSISSDSDEWVRWASGVVPLTPGTMYAVKIWVQDGCAMYKRDKDALSYADGCAFDQDGNAQNFDLNCTVFVDRDGKAVTHTRISSGPGAFDGDDNDTRWGQSFIATGTSLAAADLFNANGSEPFTLTWEVFTDGPGGTQVGLTKITEGAYFAASTDLAGVCYDRGQVPLTPGETYYIEVSQPAGFTPYRQELWQRYGDGQAFRQGTPVDADLAMSIVEYLPVDEPEPDPNDDPNRPIDINDDGQVNLADFGLLGAQWGQSGAELVADFNGDEMVDLVDLCRLTAGWLDGAMLLGDDLLANGDFEGGFGFGGVGRGWTAIELGADVKENPRLGRVGGGVYGTEFVDSGHGDVNSDYQTMRLHGKVHVIDASRFDVVSKLQNQLGPEVFTIAKLGAESYFGGAQEALAGDPYANGQAFADHCLNESTNAGHWAHAYYGLNEANVNDAGDMAKIATFELGFTERLHEHGMRSVVLNNSVGTPGDLNNMLLPEVVALFAVADYVGYHSYGAPGEELMCAPGSLEWYSLRWRKVADMYAAAGHRMPPVIYTEGTTWWAWHDDFTPAQIRDDLITFSDYMAEDDWCVGLAVFCTGNWGGQVWSGWNIANYPGWSAGQYHEIVEPVRDYNRTHPVDAHTGVNSQELMTMTANSETAITQVIATIPGQRYSLSGYFRYEFTGYPNYGNFLAGADATGQTSNPFGATVNYGPEIIATNTAEGDCWHRFRHEFTATGANASIWLRLSKTGSSQTCLYLDDLSVRGVIE